MFFSDLVMWNLYAFGHYELFCRELRNMMDFAGVDKTLFGTDDLVFKIVRSTNEWIRLLKELPENAPATSILKVPLSTKIMAPGFIGEKH